MFPDADESDMVHIQRIARETVEYLREVEKRVNITTGTVERGVAEALRKSWMAKKLTEHERKIGDMEHRQEGLEKILKRGLSQIFKSISGDE